MCFFLNLFPSFVSLSSVYLSFCLSVFLSFTQSIFQFLRLSLSVSFPLYFNVSFSCSATLCFRFETLNFSYNFFLQMLKNKFLYNTQNVYKIFLTIFWRHDFNVHLDGPFHRALADHLSSGQVFSQLWPDLLHHRRLCLGPRAYHIGPTPFWLGLLCTRDFRHEVRHVREVRHIRESLHGRQLKTIRRNKIFRTI